MKTRPKLGNLLVEAGLISQSQLDQVVANRRENGAKLGQLLARQGLVPEEAVVQCLSEQLRVPRYQSGTAEPDPELATLMPLDLARRYNVVPIRRRQTVLDLGMLDPTDLDTCDRVEQETGCEVQPVICSTREMNQLTSELYGSFAGFGAVMEDSDELEARHASASKGDEARSDQGPPSLLEAEDVEVGSLVDMAGEAPVVKMVNWIVAQAVREGASDVHLSPEADRVQLRFRLDGKLRDVPPPPKALHLSIVSRIKILSQMDIAVSRVPQDGRMTMRVDNREIHIRVSTLPTTHGENVVMRLLDMSASQYRLDDLGMDEQDRDRLRAALSRPHGMILSTGPTGSGKTTTLYAMLQVINKPDVNIVTVEDPVEYRMPHIRQVQLNARAGMTFASVLRSILRQDPDVIMVGEIRDAETARLAVQASLTGHRVFSTVHTNDAAGAITRLIDMGIEPFLVSSVLLVSFAQRLVRRVCPHCAREVEPDAESLRFWGLPTDAGIRFKQAVGCARCMGTGYQGRVGLFEVLAVDDAVKEYIAQRKPTLEINRMARETERLRTLREDAASKVRAGLTTPEEAMSVVSQ
jgi:type IV pilus assembly protein PilB